MLLSVSGDAEVHAAYAIPAAIGQEAEAGKAPEPSSPRSIPRNAFAARMWIDHSQDGNKRCCRAHLRQST